MPILTGKQTAKFRTATAPAGLCVTSEGSNVTRTNAVLTVALLSGAVIGAPAAEPPKAAPLNIGETFSIDSKRLGEKRRINVYLPPVCRGPGHTLPGAVHARRGRGRGLPHVAGLVQVSVGNGTMRPFVLVGIENTQRRDLTGPTEVAEDKKIAAKVGGSEAFRAFVRDELMPDVKARYRTTKEAAIVGESLAGLFVVETFLLESDLFDTYIAFDPSLWWNSGKLVADAGTKLRTQPKLSKALYLASSSEDRDDVTQKFADVLKKDAPAGVRWHHEKMLEEKHATIYHPAALKAFRAVLKPDKKR